MTKKSRKKPDFGSFVCPTCGFKGQRSGPSQLYCRPCSTERDIKRKGVWAVEKGRAIFNAKRAAWAQNGALISSAERMDFDLWQPPTPTMVWYRSLQLPFTWGASKNHIFTSTRTGHTFLRDEARFYRSEVSRLVAESVGAQRVYQNKLWLDLLVQKPNHKGDAANFLDLICDAVKDAIPLDDRWYSIRSIDWQICKVDPMIFIGLGQEHAVDVQACSSCGRFLTYDRFQKNRTARNGVTRVCRECQAVTRKLKRHRDVDVFA